VAFEAKADLDAKLSVVAGDEQKHPVVAVFLPEAPAVEQPVRHLLDAPSFQRRDREDDDLVRRRLLVPAELLRERGFEVRREQLGPVHHPPRQRKVEDRLRRGCRGQKHEEGEYAHGYQLPEAPPPPDDPPPPEKLDELN